MRIVIKKMSGKFDVLDVQECHIVDEPVAAAIPTATEIYRKIKHRSSVKRRLETQEERDESEFYPRVGNANWHHDKYYKSVVAASAATGVHKYWISKYCEEEVGGWKWA